MQKQLKELYARAKDFFKPYTFEDYVKEHSPKDTYELEHLEKQFNKLVSNYLIQPKF